MTGKKHASVPPRISSVHAPVASQILAELRSTKNAERALHSLRFFRTGPGEYGEGDQFFGHSVPQMRKIAQQSWKTVTVQDAAALLWEPWHEARLVALLVLVKRYRMAKTESDKKAIFDCYVQNLSRINNWDLVDLSAPNIPGAYLQEHPELIHTLWEKWLHSSELWERRVAVLATFPFIRAGEFSLILQAAEALLRDRHDLIQKAVGWMLREMGKQNEATLRAFLNKHAATMPRTMLRYAIEKFSEADRQMFLSAKDR